MPIESITTEAVERWLASVHGAASSRTKALVLLHGILKRAKKVWGGASNPVAEVEKPPVQRSGGIDVFSPEEVWALVRAAASPQDAAIYLTAAFTGLRLGELLALRWRDVDFQGSTLRVRSSYAAGVLTTPKSGKVRAVPLAPDVASVLARLSSRDDWVGDDDLAFPGDTGGYLDGSALRRRYKAALAVAGLRSLRFHDLRHTFGTRMIGKAAIRRVQEWMGHADVQTTMTIRITRPANRTRGWLRRPSRSSQRGGRLSTYRDILGYLRSSPGNFGRLGTSWSEGAVWALRARGAEVPTGLLPMISRDFGRTTWDNFCTRRECVECVASAAWDSTSVNRRSAAWGRRPRCGIRPLDLCARVLHRAWTRDQRDVVRARQMLSLCPKRMRRPERVEHAMQGCVVAFRA